MIIKLYGETLGYGIRFSSILRNTLYIFMSITKEFYFYCAYLAVSEDLIERCAFC